MSAYTVNKLYPMKEYILVHILCTNVGYMVDNLYLQVISCSVGIPREATGRYYICRYVQLPKLATFVQRLLPFLAII